MENTKILNIANINVAKNILTIEFLYKSKKFLDDFSINIVDDNGKIYDVLVYKCENKVIYNKSIGEVEVAKVLVKLELKNYGKLKFKLKDNNTNDIYEFKILNNKDESIVKSGNKYRIFVKDYFIDVNENYIGILKRKRLDLFRYELFKFRYGLKKYKKIFIYRLLKSKNNKYYLFNDRLHLGDDNAEALFTYICKYQKKFAKKCYFVLTKDSEALTRLKKVGKVLKYGGIRHKLKFINSKMVISSHASFVGNCFNPFNEDEMEMYKDKINKQFVFVQHGVAMNDIRQYVNRCLITADLYTVSTKDEFKYLSSKDYMYEKESIIGTGLPRFDKLINEDKKVILIAPTWRTFVTDKVFENSKEIKFEDSEFYKKYTFLLKNKKIKNIMKEKGYTIKFLLHPVLSEYKSLMKECEDEYVKVYSVEEINYSNLFNECSMLITDYSSIHFDVATLLKPIIYFQFDKEEFFKKHYSSGYFDYAKDGFGEVIEDEVKLEEEIIEYLSNDCRIKEKYKDKICDTFIHIDKNNSKRVFEKIVELDNRNEVNYRFNNVH